MDKKLHKTITKNWREAFRYGTDYSKITKKEMKSAINEVYKEMPELRKIALEWFEKNWKVMKNEKIHR